MPVAAVDLGTLFQVVWVSVVAGAGVATLFSLVIVASARAAEARRAGRGGTAMVNAGLAILTFLVFAVGVAVGVRIMLTK